MNDNPLVSIVITTYNCEKNLQYILDAIETQDYEMIEVVIKDGLSTDKTVSIIENYKRNSRFEVKFRSCKDNGIYDAMNQGYADTTGDIVVFCSDRLTCRDAVSSMADAISKGGDSCIGAHADLVYEADNGEIKRYWHMGEGRIKDGWMPGHPTLYLKREIYEKYGLYKTDYRIAADYEFMIRILKDEKNELAYVNKVIVSMYYGGTSTEGAGSYWESLMEAQRALKENKVKFPWKINFLRTIKLFKQFCAKK